MGSPAAGIVFTNGRVFSNQKSEAGGPVFSDTLLVKDGVIQYVGAASDATIVDAQRNGAHTEDLGNKTVLPGFIDGHMHSLQLGMALLRLSLIHCKSLADIRAAIKEYAQKNPSAPRIVCSNWMHSMIEGEALASMIDDLDSRPIYIVTKDLHFTWCNTAALDELGVAPLEDPSGGKIHRGPDGKPSGLIAEAANRQIVTPFLAKCLTMEDKLNALDTAYTAYTHAGYTGLIDMAMNDRPLDAILTLRAKTGKLPIRMSAYWLIDPSESIEDSLAQVDRAIELSKQYNASKTPDLQIVGIKLVCDGIVDACTAALREPYTSNNVSTAPIWVPETIYPVVKKADEAGLQCALHAIGDYSVQIAIDAIEKLDARGRRHRIEHLELTSPEDAKRLGELGITASVQPVHADPAILRAWPRLIGEDRFARAFAYSNFLAGGATLAIGTDSPTAPHLPLPNLYVATTRKSFREPELETIVNPQFALSVCDAISAATTGAAYSCFWENLTGSLRPGLQADFVVVDMDWTPENLFGARVSQTWVSGEKVFST